MYEVVIGTLPATGMALYLFQWNAAVVLTSCLAGCLGTEWLFNLARKKSQTIDDGSAMVTALILGLSLPPKFPWWGALLGSVVAIGVAKMLFGGLGCNIFNPAMVGRAFLMACFGMLMTTWSIPAQEQNRLKAEAQKSGREVAAVTAQTPLNKAKEVIKDAYNTDMPPDKKKSVFEVNADVQSLFVGTISGSLGETSALLWLVGGVFLLLRRTITYHIPLAVLGSAGIIATLAWWMKPDVYAHPLVHLFGGGLMMGAFFIATDPVSCPLSKLGRAIFGVGVGSLIMLIRLKGGYPEGVMYAVLLMNSMTPLLDRWTHPTPLGGHVARS